MRGGPIESSIGKSEEDGVSYTLGIGFGGRLGSYMVLLRYWGSIYAI